MDHRHLGRRIGAGRRRTCHCPLSVPIASANAHAGASHADPHTPQPNTRTADANTGAPVPYARTADANTGAPVPYARTADADAGAPDSHTGTGDADTVA